MTEIDPRDFGRLEGKVDAILVEMQTASTQRKETYQRVEGIDRRVALVESDIIEIKPSVKRLERLEQRGLGVIAAAAAIGALLVTVAQPVWNKIVSVLS